MGVYALQILGIKKGPALYDEEDVRDRNPSLSREMLAKRDPECRVIRHAVDILPFGRFPPPCTYSRGLGLNIMPVPICSSRRLRGQEAR
jgi:hypothetical protein